MSSTDPKANFERWKSSAEPEVWVRKHLEGWNHNDWLELIASLNKSQFWPMDGAAIGKHLELLRERMKTSTVECSKHPGNLLLFGPKCTSCGCGVCRLCVRVVYQGSLMRIYCADCKPGGSPPDLPIPEFASLKVHAWVKAAEDGDGRAVSLLLASGLPVDIVHESGATALYMAAETGQAEIVKILLAANANPNKTITEDRFSPLWVAARMGHAPVVRLLLNAGANVEQRTAQGDTPAMIAAEEGHREIVKLLGKL